MKFFKKLLNKFESDLNTKKHGDSDAIFSLTSASIAIEEKMALQFSGSAALCVKRIDGSLFQNTIKDCTDLLEVSKSEFKFKYHIFIDDYDYVWFIITVDDTGYDADNITNVAAGLSSIGDIIEENGFEEEILSAVFKYIFVNKEGYLEGTKNNSNNNKNLYLIYNYKTNNFYPYIPTFDNNSNQYHRDTTREMQTLSILKNLISVETDITKWYPIKDIPF